MTRFFNAVFRFGIGSICLMFFFAALLAGVDGAFGPKQSEPVMIFFQIAFDQEILNAVAVETIEEVAEVGAECFRVHN